MIKKAKEYFKQKYNGVYCIVCGFNFETKYGLHGEDFIECHHIIPICELKYLKEGDQTSITDLVPLCSNCHSMIHRKKPWLSVDKLKQIISESQLSIDINNKLKL